jgi:hypothetical protein
MNQTSAGSLIQLIATGPQDLHIHEKNSSFLFKTDYKKHSQFGFEQHDILIDASFSKEHVIEIPHNGHLLKSCILHIKLPKLLNEQKYCGITYTKLIKSLKVCIDDTTLLNFDGLFLYIMYNLCLKESKLDGINEMTQSQLTNSYHLLQDEKNMYIPIILWDLFANFNYIPIAGIKFQKLKLIIEFASIEELYVPHPLDSKQIVVPSLQVKKEKIKLTLRVETNAAEYEDNMKCSLLIDYIILNTQEMQLMIQSKQEYPYIQIVMQKEYLMYDHNKIYLHFNIPIQQLIWVISDYENPDAVDLRDFTKARMLIGNDNDLDGKYFESNYFKYIQNNYHSERIPDVNIYSYSFGLRPLYGHPSGMVDFGKLKHKILEIHGNIKGKYITIYGHGMNVLQTHKGFSSLKRNFK